MTHSGARGPAALEPATLAFDEQGLPVSERYADRYKSRDGAIAEAEHVFISGNRIAERSANGSLSTVLEAGFGLGINLFATWTARERAGWQRPLHYVGIDAHPVEAAQLQRTWARLGLNGALPKRLLGQWPEPTRGRHRIHLPTGIVLTLIYDDIEPALAGLDTLVDAIYLDGFSPRLNPRMWSPTVMRALARASNPGATTLATYSSASGVRETLGAAGFDVTRQPGFSGKRHCLIAVYAPRWTPRQRNASLRSLNDADPVAVVGDGLAATLIASTLATSGRAVSWFGSAGGEAIGRSGQPVLAAHPHLSPDDNPLSRICRAALSAWRSPEALGGPGWHGIDASPMDRLFLATSRRDAELRASLPDRAGLPATVTRWLDADEASDAAGVTLSQGALWMRNLPLVALDTGQQSTIRPHPVPVAELQPAQQGWRLLGADGRELQQARAVVLATGDCASGLLAHQPACRRVRGQSTRVSAPHLTTLRAILGASAYTCPLGDGTVLVGSSYDERDMTEADPHDDAGNIARLTSMLPETTTPVRRLGSAVGFRHTLADRLPAIGPALDGATLVDDPCVWRRDDRLALPTLPNVYIAGGFGSRGVLWAALAASLINDLLNGAPTLLERPLREAVSPVRFARRALRRGHSIAPEPPV